MSSKSKNSLTSTKYRKFAYSINMLRLISSFVTGVLFLPLQQVKSEEIFLKCIGKYEINRGELIRPDWDTSFLTINLDGLISTIHYEGIKKEGRTRIRQNTYIITYRDTRNRIKAKYRINGIHNTYTIEYPQSGRQLIGTCQKGRG